MHIVIVLGCKRNLRSKPKKEIDEFSHVYSRLIKTIDVYNGIESEEKIVLCSGIGEAEIMRDFLVDHGIKKSRILVETESRNTVENCIYSYNYLYRWLRMEHSLEHIEGDDISLDLTQRKEFHLLNVLQNTIHLVTNDYHIDRSEKIFKTFHGRLKSSLIKTHDANILDYIQPNEKDKEEPTIKQY